MRLQRFEIRKFKGIQDVSFCWEDIVVLIGENNAGKSTVLQALQCFLSGSQIKDEALFFDNVTDDDNAIELVGHFDQLTDEEMQSTAVRGRMHRDKWIVKKRFWSETDSEEGGGQSWKEQYYSFSAEEAFVNWPEPDNAWGNFPEEYRELIEQIANRGTRPNAQTRESLRELVRENKPELVAQSDPKWVPNPGGGGNWKSNANSIMPRFILAKAVHDATDEAVSKEASSYGRIISLIVEKKMMLRPEVVQLKKQIETVLQLFRPDPDHPERQAEEIQEVERRINERLNQVIGGVASIKTSEPDIRPVLLPNTTLVLRDDVNSIATAVGHQGHGLQRTLILTLLQVLAEIQAEPEPTPEGEVAQQCVQRPVILGIEEPELYMHPQMQRKMRDVLYRLADQQGFQVICTTHSPVFLNIGDRHKSIVRLTKSQSREVTLSQVNEDLFDATDAASEKDRLRLIANFHPTVNEVFFAKRVVLLEEQTALSAFERAAELTGLFERHPHVRRDVTMIDCLGKGNIPMFQQVLNHFQIPYAVIHDEDQGDAAQEKLNVRIDGLLLSGHTDNCRYMISPKNIEVLLGYGAGKDKPYQAFKKVEELHAAGALPSQFVAAVNWAYFGQVAEPAA